MKSNTYPLAMPEDLLNQVRQTAKQTGLSLADAMRQSMRLGLPKLAEQLASDRLAPMTPEERRRCYQEPNPEFDALESHCANLPKPLPEDE